MRFPRFSRIWLIVAWFILLPVGVLAQAPEPEATITIVGQITNGTPGGEVPEGLPVMLHTFDGEAMTGMTDGTSDANGGFRFENVPFSPGQSFEVMVTYQDVTYFSERIAPEAGQTQLELPVTIYETTTDATTVQVEQLHLLLDFTPGAMHVVQIYILSNTGDRTVVAEDQKGLRFHLPDGAVDVDFEDNLGGERFVRLEDGFVDTAPVPPGTGTLPVVVRYALPYQDQIELAVPVDYPTLSADVLLPEMGVTLNGEGWNAEREMLLRGRIHQVYSYDRVPATPGDSLQLAVAGKPDMSARMTDPAAETAVSNGEPPWVLITGVVLALLLIGAGGLWWWLERRQAVAPIPASASTDAMASLLRAMADLDEAREAGTIDDATYREQRARLRAQAMTLLASQEDVEQ